MMNARKIAVGMAAVALTSLIGILLALASPGVTHVPVVPKTPCWLNKAEVGPSGYNEVIVGYLRGRLTTGGSIDGVADAFYDSETGDCGWADSVAADFPPNTKMWIRVDSAFAIDAHATNAGRVVFTFSIQEKNSTNCTGTTTWSPSPITTTITLPASYDWAEVDPWGGFHFERNSPGASSTRSYLYNIKAEAGITGGASSSWNQTGCFAVGTSG